MTDFDKNPQICYMEDKVESSPQALNNILKKKEIFPVNNSRENNVKHTSSPLSEILTCSHMCSKSFLHEMNRYSYCWSPWGPRPAVSPPPRPEVTTIPILIFIIPMCVLMCSNDLFWYVMNDSKMICNFVLLVFELYKNGIMHIISPICFLLPNIMFFETYPYRYMSFEFIQFNFSIIFHCICLSILLSMTL